MQKKPLPSSFFARPTIRVARALLGQLLVFEERVGRIVETEAYLGPHDLACHTSKGRTARNEVMFGPPGFSYVFLVYGMHFCFNVTTGKGAAVLIRALEPVTGLERRADGPGRLTAALGITRAHNGLKLDAPPLWVAEGALVPPREIARGPRIGVDYAKEWAAKPYRFWEKDNPHVS